MIQLTDEENNLIVEALLFSSCLEITDEWSVDDRNTMLVIANKIKNSTTTLKNIELHNFNENNNDIKNNICISFPDINKVQHITLESKE